MKILDIALKDLVRSTRSLFLVGMALAAPLLITGLIYFAFGGMSSGDVGMTAIKVGVVNSDTLPPGSPLEIPLGDNIRSMFFDESVKSWIEAADFAGEAAARAALDAQQIGVVVIIPPAFTQDYFAGAGNSSVTVLQDPTLTIGPNVVRDMLTSMLDGAAGAGVLFKVVTARMEANGKAADPAMLPALFGRYADWYGEFQRALFHSPDKAALVVRASSGSGRPADSLAGMMALIMSGQLIFFSFFTGAYAMMSILQEAEEGTLARLFTTPTGRTAILAGKFLAVLFTVMLQGLVLLAAGRLLFGIRWGGTGAVLLTLLGQMVASVGLAVLLVSFIKTSKQAGPIFGGALTGLGMISGLFTTNVQMPEAFNAIGSLTPQGWVLKAWKLSLAGQPAAELMVPFIVLLAMGILMFAAGALLFKRRFA
jgi:ABC-2 type transport system permease protein